MVTINLEHIRSIEYYHGNDYGAAALQYTLIKTGLIPLHNVDRPPSIIGVRRLRFQQGGLRFYGKVFITRVIYTERREMEIEFTEDLEGWQRIHQVQPLGVPA